MFKKQTAALGRSGLFSGDVLVNVCMNYERAQGGRGTRVRIQSLHMLDLNLHWGKNGVYFKQFSVRNS